MRCVNFQRSSIILPRQMTLCRKINTSLNLGFACCVKLPDLAKSVTHEFRQQVRFELQNTSVSTDSNMHRLIDSWKLVCNENCLRADAVYTAEYVRICISRIG